MKITSSNPKSPSRCPKTFNSSRQADPDKSKKKTPQVKKHSTSLSTSATARNPFIELITRYRGLFDISPGPMMKLISQY